MDAVSVIILAAGKGTRMNSDLPKVLHPVAGKPMVLHVIACARQVTSDRHIHVVVGHQARKVQQAVTACYRVNFSLQKALLGTGDAVKCAIPALAPDVKQVVILYGDVPLIQPETVVDLVSAHRTSCAKVTILAADMDKPSGYGRIISDPLNRVIAIREEADASDEEKKIRRINTGIYCFDRQFLEMALDQLKPDNLQAEYYLTDVVGIASQKNENVAVKVLTDISQVRGVNTLDDLEKTRNMHGRMQNELP
jgi:UDP-N-acetylglucosamine diphosphorylase/glucosamine-1-phosphate N-acetyltransferase